MDLESVETCNICMDSFDETVRPRVLPCGHDLCGSCLTNSIKQGTITCPHCQKSHPATNSGDFPINYRVESLLSVLRQSKSGAIHKDISRSKSQSGKKWQSFFSDEKDNLRSLIQSCEEKKPDLLTYDDYLRQQKNKHEEFIPKFYELAHQNEEIVKEIEAEQKRLSDTVKEGEEYKEDATSTLSKFDHITSTNDFVTGSDEVERCQDALEEWKTSLKHFPNVKTISCSKNILRKSTVLDLVNTFIDEDTGDNLCLAKSSLTTMEMVNFITLSVDNLQLTKWQGAPESIKTLVEKGYVYAIQNNEGQIRSARITMKEGKTFLHYLENKEPPAYACKIKQSELIGTLKADSVTVFMDLAWEGIIRGRIHINLSPDTPLARHFRILCCGDLGPSYALSRFLEVGSKGDATCERVSGGDYEKNDGNGGAPLISGLNPSDRIYYRNYEAGIVWSRYNTSDGPNSAQFIITTGRGTGGKFPRVFGHIQKGLEIVKSAAKHHDIRQVTIQDCGVVLPF